MLLALAPSCAAAQDDVVVITATRQPQPSLEVPASVDRIYADEIREGRPQVNLSESLGRVPGIVVQNRQNYAQDLQISSRGFGARSTFGVRGIRLIADGIPASMPDGQGQAATFALGSAQRIEVLRGPFSSLYGNAAGGVISIETEDGPPTPTFAPALLLGSYGTWREAAKYGGQWGALNGIVDASHFHTEGYRQHSEANRDHVNGKLKYELNPDTSFAVIGNTLRQPQTQDPLGLDRNQLQQDPRQVTPQAIQFNTRKTITQDQLGLTLNHRLDPASNVQATVYGGQRFVEQYLAIPLAAQNAPTHSGGVVNLDRKYGGVALRYFTQFSRVRLSTGLEYETMEERRKGFINNFGVAGALKRDENNDVSTTGLFAQGEWKFAERWAAHAGVRTTTVQFRSRDSFLSNGDDSGAKSYRGTTPVAGLVFRMNPRTSLYGNLGRGFETPTFVELANRGPGQSGLNFDLDASRSRHGEVGVKTLVSSWVRLNAALFKIVNENEIVVDQNTGGRASFKNVGHTDRKGFELGAETLLAGPFEARVAYTYLKAAFRESFTTVLNTLNTPVNVPAGSFLPGVPKSVLYGELRYRAEPFYGQLEALHKSRVPVNDPNLEFADAYTSLNLMAGVVQQGRGWRVTEFARIDNLTDRNYVGSVIVNETNGRFYEPSPRRNMSIGIQASLQF
ncbi:MAG TPA: TonB-dependent receptor [Burkholderiales bacterium]|nr:TonB-dependent receptor [Burkholderiales bacterium]